MIKILKNQLKNRKLTNLFGTQFDKNVLVSYIVYPLRVNNFDSHNNQLEVRSICQVFNQLGYNVDVVFYLSTERLSYDKYDVVFGFGEPMARSYAAKKPLQRILYATGSHPDFQNQQSLTRIKAVYQKTGIYMVSSGRLAQNNWPEQYWLAEDIIVLGNQRTAQTFASLPARLHTLNNFYPPKLTNFQAQPVETELQKQSFLYFTSNGAVHRGLDLLIEFFSQHSQYQLHICSHLEPEVEFMSYYQKYLTGNIQYHGRNSLYSETFQTLVNNCAFAILPSCSEGQSTSVINVATTGLIPLITPECGLDLPNKAIPIAKVESQAIATAIETTQKLSLDQINQRRSALTTYCQDFFTLDAYEQNLKTIIQGIIKA